ncbi:hypothetical protein BDV37DRAFT_262327 [Aspergillus pseudonomiae]|uniref:Uncharacterized protein n=1 Tax=Aspergillus pseudonomiae TaxID=1506151 RepID=A0A5N7CY29_9EURO|nr:uncharacterized protein BDV37DRAFT_262327 [Aspergillus pseudonomiae]KAE8398859.1 hypothetical protein BDV37DRAFT_262327 [Aspergillus pseudonomiae]
MVCNFHIHEWILIYGTLLIICISRFWEILQFSITTLIIPTLTTLKVLINGVLRTLLRRRLGIRIKESGN